MDAEWFERAEKELIALSEQLENEHDPDKRHALQQEGWRKANEVIGQAFMTQMLAHRQPQEHQLL